MDAIIVLLGFIIGVFIFLFAMEHVVAIIYSCQSVIITFCFCWGIGIVLAWVAWKLAIIVGIICAVLFVVDKISGSNNKENSDDITG